MSKKRDVVDDTINIACINLLQPYADLVASGRKTLETRTSGVLSRHRGPLVIVASQKPGKAHDVYGRHAVDRPEGFDITAGHAIAVVNVVATGKPVKGTTYRWLDSATGEEIPKLCRPDDDRDLEVWKEQLRRSACFGPVGRRWLTVLKKATWLTRPIPTAGRLGIYTAPIPRDVLPAWAVR